MKRMWVPMMIALVVVSLQHSVFAYDYRNDTINDADKAIVSELNNSILSDLMLLDPNSPVQTYSRPINWNQAKKVFAFDTAVFLNALQTGTLEDELVSATTLWKVPIYNDETGYGYAITSATNSEDRGYVTVSAPVGVLNQAEYLFLDDPIPENVNIENASVYITSVPEHSIDFLTIAKENDVILIPFSTRPDLLGLTNGIAYSASEMWTIISNYIVSSSGSESIAAGGGHSNDASNAMIVPAGIILIVIAVVLIKKKTKLTA